VFRNGNLANGVHARGSFSSFVLSPHDPKLRPMSRAVLPALLAAFLLASPGVAAAASSSSDAELSGEGSGVEVGATSLLAFGMLPSAGLGAGVYVKIDWGPSSVLIEPRILFSLESKHVGATIDTPTYLPGGAISMCKTRGGFFGCGVFQVSKLLLGDHDPAYVEEMNPVMFTSGVRGGLTFELSDSLVVTPLAELHAIVARPYISWNNTAFWVASPIAGVLGVSLSTRL
jgi:hypothetical protein